jgi:hypothetical protein
MLILELLFMALGFILGFYLGNVVGYNDAIEEQLND